MASFNHSWLSSPLTETPTFFLSPSQQPKSLKLSLFRTRSNSSSPERSSEVEVDPVKLALKKAEAYKKSKSEREVGEKNAGEEELPLSVKAAMQKANDYKKRKGLGADVVEEPKPSSVEQSLVRSSNKVVEDNDVKKKELKVSSIDFMGLGFADKKTTRGLPAGLVPVIDYLPEGDLPEVEFIVGDKTRFAETDKDIKQEGDENSDVYKPKVSTWGVFPRPSNISKTSELHGQAALQWSICQDSLRKANKARGMYEKLLSHPNPRVSKKARQFMFSFQAMEMLKVKGSSYMEGNTGYQNYFEAFVKDNVNYKAQEDNEREAMGIDETLLYVILLASPILMVFVVAAQRGNIH
ncbi:hypothetical protein CARUB_v10023248mg [Capsella rubella]|uniref:Uncharacterized protein n=1 Tax=Capsella rubella TaxID=81985 RepID=R0HCG4_9BRAS|nr:hypothetical protein CARUB_v10023248mg [Capsella rubella]